MRTGPQIFWETPDRRTKIIRYCHGVFGLEHDGVAVMEETTFERINAYTWAEFINVSWWR